MKILSSKPVDSDVLLFDWMIVAFVVVVAVLRGPLSARRRMREQGLRAIGNLAIRLDNRRLLGVAGACEGKCTSDFILIFGAMGFLSLVIFIVVVVVSALWLSTDSAGVAEHGLRALGNLAVRVENSKLLGTAGACEGESVLALTETNCLFSR